jgi:hypothetical protein
MHGRRKAKVKRQKAKVKSGQHSSGPLSSFCLLPFYSYGVNAPQLAALNCVGEQVHPQEPQLQRNLF